MELGPEAWDPLFDDKTNRVLLVPILTLGTQEGLDQIDAGADPASEYAAGLILLVDNKRSKSKLFNSLYKTGDHHNKLVWLNWLRNVHLIAR
jgi:hypothetical protein